MSGKEKSKQWADILSAINATVRDMLRGSKEWDGLEPLEPRMMLDGDLTAAFTPVSPHVRNSEVNGIQVVFSEPVTGVGVDDIELAITRNGATISLPLSSWVASIPTSEDGTTYWLNGLAGLTNDPGTYEITLVASGSGIRDASSNELLSDASTSWHMFPNVPTMAPNQSFTIDENAPEGTLVGMVSASDDDINSDDPEQSDALTYSIIPGEDSEGFDIDAATGEITVTTPSMLDFETTHSFTLTVQVDDLTGQTTSEDVTINLTDLPPVSMNIPSGSVSVEGDAFVLTLTARDLVDDPVQIWTVDWGDGWDPSTGTRPTSGNYWGEDIAWVSDHWEAWHVYNGPQTAYITATAICSDENDVHELLGQTVVQKAMNLDDATFCIPANAVDGHTAGAVVATYRGSHGPVTYSITDGNDYELFTIDGATGEITIPQGELLEHFANSVQELTVLAIDDNGKSDTAIIAVAILPVPVVTTSASSVESGDEDAITVTVDFPSSLFDNSSLSECAGITQCWIDWGDGTLSSTENCSSTWMETHTYSIYDSTIEVSGYPISSWFVFAVTACELQVTGSATTQADPVTVRRGPQTGVPAAPYDLMAYTGKDGTVHFSWSVTAGSPSSFTLYGAPLHGSGDAWSRSLSDEDCTVNDNVYEYPCPAQVLTAGTTYECHIVAVAEEPSLHSNLAVVTARALQPAAPEDLTPKAEHGRVKLSWSDANEEYCYNLYRAVYTHGETVEDRIFELIKTGLSDAPTTGTPFIDEIVEVGVSYAYRLTSVSGDMEGEPSSEVIVLAAPTDIEVTLQLGENEEDEDTVTMSWWGASGATKYRIYRGGAAEALDTITSGGGNGSFSCDGLPVHAGDHYWVAAVMGEGDDEQEGMASPAAVVLRPTIGDGMVSLSWNAITGPDHLDLYRNGHLYNPGLDPESAASLDDVLMGGPWSYEMVSTYANGDSAVSSAVMTTNRAPNAPSCNLVWPVDAAGLVVRIAGLPEARNGVSYELQKQIDDGAWLPVGDGEWVTPTSGPRYYDDDQATSDGEYHYRFKSVSEDEELPEFFSRPTAITPALR